MLEIIKLILKLIFFSFCQVVFISNVTGRARYTSESIPQSVKWLVPNCILKVNETAGWSELSYLVSKTPCIPTACQL
jgi:hypothetical protein